MGSKPNEAIRTDADDGPRRARTRPRDAGLDTDESGPSGAAEFTPPAGSLHQSSRCGSLWVWTPMAGLLVTRARGHVAGGMAKTIMDAATTAIECTPGGLSIFHHWVDVIAYEACVRPMFVRWGLSNLGRCAGFHFLTGGRAILDMGISLAGIVVPRVHRHRTEDALLAAYREARAALCTTDRA